MCGYQEELTDPAYHNKLLAFTYPSMGHYGFNGHDTESPYGAAGIIVNSCSDTPNNFRSEMNAAEFLASRGVVGISGIDTRYVSSLVRDAGGLNALVTTEEITSDLRTKLQNYKEKPRLKDITTDCTIAHFAEREEKCKVSLLDFGVKNSTVRAFTLRGAAVTVYPAATDVDKAAKGADYLVIAGGVGTPDELAKINPSLNKVFGLKIPVMAIGAGHLALAVSAGIKIGRLHAGHRGANHPVKNVSSGKVYGANQNHDYYAAPNNKKGVAVTYVNFHDGTCEGLSYSKKPDLVSVQFHPEGAGAQDMLFMFDEFLAV